MGDGTIELVKWKKLEKVMREVFLDYRALSKIDSNNELLKFYYKDYCSGDLRFLKKFEEDFKDRFLPEGEYPDKGDKTITILVNYSDAMSKEISKIVDEYSGDSWPANHFSN